MKVLVIGGSLFVGRVFVLTARKENEITVLNRGHYPLKIDGVREIKADRRDPGMLKQFGGEHFDAVVDVCCYEEGDIRRMFAELDATFDQYIMISSLDVTRRQVGYFKDETEEYETRNIQGQIGQYIKGKIILEKELMECAKEAGIPYTIVRCAFIYGPFNYGQREPWYVQQLLAGKPVYEPVDSDSVFNLLYVKDLAKQLVALCGNEGAYNEIFNLCNDELVTYKRFFELLRKLDVPNADIREISLKDAEGIHFPFPVTAQESELFTNTKIQELTGIPFTDFETGMMHTLELFCSIYGGR